MFKKLRWLFAKRASAVNVPTAADFDEIVKAMYDKGLDGFDDEIASVVYSKDKTKRYIILKSSRNIFTYRFEQLCFFDFSPAYWTEAYDVKTNSFYSTKQNAETGITEEPYYKQYFA